MSQSIRQPNLLSITVQGYKAFAAATHLKFGRVTVILGRNNAGKTALCCAPAYFARALDPGAPAPFPPIWKGVDFGTLQSVCYRRQATGLAGTLELDGVSSVRQVRLEATTLPEHQHEQFITHLEIHLSDGGIIEHRNLRWTRARDELRKFTELAELSQQVQILRGLRPLPDPAPLQPAETPISIGVFGEQAPQILYKAGSSGLAAVNDWFQHRLGVSLTIENVGRDRFEILARGHSGEPVNITQSGAGLAHVLPLVVAVRLAKERPSLWCIEQPELQLHPRAHVAIAELLIESLINRPESRLLIESHSDVLVLRLRREVAAGRLSPRDVRLYFADDAEGPSSQAREIPLNDQGTPAWWPKDVFSEPQREYFAIRRELAHREDKP